MRMIVLLVFVLSFIPKPLNATSFSLHGGVGYTTSFGKDIDGFGYHIGVRILLQANPTKKYGLEITHIEAVAKEDRGYLAVGIVLEEKRLDWLNLSIGTIGYIDTREGVNPFGVLTTLGWEPKMSESIKPIVAYRGDWIFDKVTLCINSISIGIRF